MATNRRFSRGLELPAVLAAGLAIAIADARAQVQVGDPTTSSVPKLDVRRLPEGPAGIASEARSAVIDGTSNTLMIGGRLLLGNDGGIWRAAVWAQAASDVIGPVMLQDRGFGGTANSIVVNGQGGDDMLAIGGAVRNEAGTEFPAIWIESADGELSDAALHTLPTPADRGGTVNRVAAGDVNNDGVVDIIACGSFAGSSGNERAAVARLVRTAPANAAASWSRAGKRSVQTACCCRRFRHCPATGRRNVGFSRCRGPVPIAAASTPSSRS
ncbi:MAG: VCBS repeat-containing protein [Planctomycetes bacterium]|nr:VCBS repeat-containing protein [Planctomycetota bacterium]